MQISERFGTDWMDFGKSIGKALYRQERVPVAQAFLCKVCKERVHMHAEEGGDHCRRDCSMLVRGQEVGRSRVLPRQPGAITTRNRDTATVCGLRVDACLLMLMVIPCHLPKIS